MGLLRKQPAAASGPAAAPAGPDRPADGTPATAGVLSATGSGACAASDAAHTQALGSTHLASSQAPAAAVLASLGLPASAAAGQLPQPGQSSSRLLDLISVLAQQGTNEQQQKLSSTLQRLQQQQQQQQLAGHQNQEQHRQQAAATLRPVQEQPQQPQAQLQPPCAPHQQAAGQQEHSKAHAEQLQKLKQCRAQQQLRQLEGLLSPRSYQQQQQQQHGQHMQGQAVCEQVHTRPQQLQGQQQAAQQCEAAAQQCEAAAQQCEAAGYTSCAPDKPFSLRRPSQDAQQQHGTQESQHLFAANTPKRCNPRDVSGIDSAESENDSDCVDGSDNDRRSSSSHTSTSGSSRSSSPDDEPLGAHRANRCSAAASGSCGKAASTSSRGCGDHINSLRASASRLLQAQMSGHRPSHQPLPASSAPRTIGFVSDSDRSARQRSKSSGCASPARVVLGSPAAAAHQPPEQRGSASSRQIVQHSSGMSSPRAASLSASAAAAVQHSLELLRKGCSTPGNPVSNDRSARARAASKSAASSAAADAHGMGGSEASPTAAMLRKAAQLAMSSSMEISRRSSSARLSRQQLPAPLWSSGVDALRSSSSSFMCRQSDDREGGEFELPRGASTSGSHNSSNSSKGGLRGSASNAGRLGSQSAAAADAASSHVALAASTGHDVSSSCHRRSSSHMDCLRPASLDVDCSSVDHHLQERQRAPSSSNANHLHKLRNPGAADVVQGSAVGSSRELDALPGSAVSSPSKDTNKAAFAVNLSLSLGTASSPSQGPRSPHHAGSMGMCRSPYQQFKASAAAAAAAAGGSTGKDQRQLSPGSKSRRGLPQSPPSAYIALLRGLD